MTRKLRIGLSEYSLNDIPKLVDKTKRYRDLIRLYQKYVSVLEDTGIDSLETRTTRLSLRDKLLFVASKDKCENQAFCFFNGELEEIAYKEVKRLLSK